jgi:diacylglycerol kinase family enzyme
VTVVVNRLAGRFRDRRWEDDVLRVLGQRLRPTVVHPANGDDTARVALAHARAGAAAIAVAGGDGTVNRVVNALDGTDVPIAILPRGTANDLARELGIPTAPEAAAQRIVDGRLRVVDLIDVNDRTLATVGGLGLPASCALCATRLKERIPIARAALGTSVYSVAAAATVLAGSNDVQRLRLVIRRPRGRTIVVERPSHGLLIANQRRFGGRLALPTASESDDGMFEVAFLPAGNRGRLLATLAALRFGRTVSRRALRVWRVVGASVECERPTAVFGDGDLLGLARRFTLRVRPGALRVVC